MKDKRMEIGLILLFIGIITIVISAIIMGIISVIDSSSNMYINTRSIGYVINMYNESKLYRYSFISLIVGIIEVIASKFIIKLD